MVSVDSWKGNGWHDKVQKNLQPSAVFTLMVRRGVSRLIARRYVCPEDCAKQK